MNRNFTFDMTQERYERIKEYVEKHKAFNSMGFFLNYAADFYIDHRRSKQLSDFLYYIGFPLVAFICFISLMLYFSDFFFYILTSIIGVYLIILCYLFVNKYRGKVNG
jgi:hypothetical protein